jgi:hypothetical protein
MVKNKQYIAKFLALLNDASVGGKPYRSAPVRL